MKTNGKTSILRRIIMKIISWVYEEEVKNDVKRSVEAYDRTYHMLMADFHKQEIEKLMAILYTQETGIPVPSGRLDMSFRLPPKKHRQKKGSGA